MARQCIDYLNLPAFERQPTEDRILEGEYGFMDYAVLHWTRHLEAGTVQANSYEHLMNNLAESLETFIRKYWTGPTVTLSISAGTKNELRYFQDLPFYENLEQAVESSKKQLRLGEEMKKGEIALSLQDTVCEVRTALERLVSSGLEPSVQQTIEERYGNNLFKCPTFDCQFFTEGFPSAQDRDNHLARQTRPYRCANKGCRFASLGFQTAAHLDRHMKTMHPTIATLDLEFPTDEDVSRSIQNNTAEEQANQEPTEFSASEPEDEQQQSPRQTRSKHTEFKCPHCTRVYTKKSNLTSHLLSHTNLCVVCGATFAMEDDYNRHVRNHAE